MSNNVQTSELSRLPVDVKTFMTHRKGVINRSLNDLVEDMHLALYADEKKGSEYIGLLDAVYDEQAIEGSLSADNICAAKMIRDLASDRGISLADQKLATISKCLNTVLRRYSYGRKERRNMVGGVVIDGNNGD